MPTIQEMEKKIFTEEHLQAMDYFFQNMKVVNKVILKMNAAKRKEDSKSRTEIAKCIGAKLSEVEFTQLEDFVSDAARDYFVHQLIQQGIGKPLTAKFLAFDGKSLAESYRLTSEVFKVKDTKVTVKPLTIRITIGDKECIFMPASIHGYGREQTTGEAWICCRKDHLDEIIQSIEKLRIAYNPIKNAVVTLGRFLEIVEFKEKFHLEQVVITPYLREEMDLIVQMFKGYKTLVDEGIPFKRGVMFAGPPGTGKTTTVNALIRDVLAIGGTVFVFSSTEQVSIEGLYKYVNQFKPALIVLEDYDLIAAQRLSVGCGQTSSELLNVLEGTLGIEGVITIATTNRVDVLDEAAIRPGRIDKIYAVDVPDMEMKLKLLQLHLELYKTELSLEDAKGVLEEFLNQSITGAAISSMVLGATQRAKAHGRKVSLEDLQWSASGVRKQQSKIGF